MRFLPFVIVLIACSSPAPTGAPDAGESDAAVPDAAVPDAGVASCSEIVDEAACNARLDCVAAYCLLCSCQASFFACQRPDDPPFNCPDLDCAPVECCETADDCPNPIISACVAPNEPFPTCGQCFPEGDPDCASDDDCKVNGDWWICAPNPCSCEGVLGCQAGCSGDASCPHGEVCGSDHRCATASCEPISGNCPKNTTCELNGASEAVCLPRKCGSDGECDPGAWCVNGLCEAGLGTCEYLPG